MSHHSYDTVAQFRSKRDEAVQAIRGLTAFQPDILLILGTGLGQLAREMSVETSIPYDQIPHFPVSTVESHAGKLLFGTLGGKRLVAMQGRFHYYEGYSMQQIVFPVRVAKALGVTRMIVSNACGGLNPIYRRADLMLIHDHINLLGDNPLIGPNDEELGPRFPDMSEPYSQSLLALAERCALESGIKVHKGVYAALTGPMLETRSEYRFLRAIGADVVGMSTIPEVIAAVHMGLEVLGLSVITDECFPDSLVPVSLEHVLAAAAQAEPNLTRLVIRVLESLA
jgi:purine-nucleoside phosphorylase